VRDPLVRIGKEVRPVVDLRAVLFDLDGVLVDSREAWFRTVQAAARRFRVPPVERDKFDAGFGQGVDADMRDFFPGCKQPDIERFYEDHLLDFHDVVAADSEARTTLLRLRELGIPRGVVTNTPTFLARDILACVGLLGLIDVTVGAGEGRRSKPEPDVVVAACNDLELSPLHAMVVGDSPFDEQAALTAGSQFFGLRMPGRDSAHSLAEVLRFFDAARA
jgi:beta-phosphoglucomutase-like phosphatase (HAD superfamily)